MYDYGYDYEYDYDDFASFSVKTKQKRNKTIQNKRKSNTKITVNYITCIIIITTIIIALSSLTFSVSYLPFGCICMYVYKKKPSLNTKAVFNFHPTRK